MLLANKNAIIYGASGAIGSAVAHTFAAEGARVFLAGRTRATLEVVAEKIRASGGVADVDPVDVMDEGAVEALSRGLAAELGPLGVRVVCVNAARMPETPGLTEVYGPHADAYGITREAFEARMRTAPCASGCRRSPRSPTWPHSWRRTGPPR
ncbi:SDR family NAD(P)-dependent oxidoreductase [Microbispora sp. RL4-1S]|uniref:SDR family NAD(P)-dependent oxidoreductase n=1 Tax=Microbispora oryzae TaxID=2806554 RepID=A0A940WLW8_9ACTN|nr:SDR family NAD(P)-dependent oxidoreductase [Microbispora oryzae]MBP2707896.1 SDR family NAD(P)-dependent oxidoreductase [Microbispora oryzae]